MPDHQTAPKAQHTPGPWRAFCNADGSFVVEDDNRIAIISRGHAWPDSRLAEAKANARLIAAAPELLVALQMSVPALEWCQKQWANSPQQGDGVNVLSVVRAAIAKAEGR